MTWGDQAGDVKAVIFTNDGTPASAEIAVNTATLNAQTKAVIAPLAGGGFAIAWQDSSNGVGGATGDNSGFSAVKAQVFTAAGAMVGQEILVNTAINSFQATPQITPLTNGGFAIAWADNSAGVGGATGDSSSTAIKAQVFDGSGTRIGVEILVNTATAGQQTLPTITALGGGGFVAMWEDNSLGVGGAAGDSSATAIKAQVFTADGTKDGGEILVNTAVAGAQSQARVDALANGGFVVSWTDGSQGVGGATGDTSAEAIKAQVFQVTTGNPTPLVVSINDVTVTEGDAGTTQATFTVALSGVPLTPVQVQFATIDGTATAGTDYVSASGAVTFAAGETTKTITIDVIGDADFEGDETFFVVLTPNAGATIADPQAQVTIRNDDGSLAISNVTVTEGDAGTTNAVFAVTLSADPSEVVTVDYGTVNGTAAAGQDYAATSGALTFAPGGPLTQQITVPVIGDTNGEGDETFTLELSNAAGAAIGTGVGLGTIIDDDDLVVAISDVTGPELDTGDTPIAVFNVTLSGTPSSPVTVNYTVDPGTATPGADYSPASGVVAFNAGETSKIIEVAIIGDNDPEADETFFVNLTSASGAAIGDGQGVGTIVDDDENVVLVNVVSNLPLDPPLISDRFVKVADVVLTGLGAGTTLSAQGSVGPYEGGDWLRIGPANEVLFDYNRAAFQEYGEEYLFALNFFVLADDPVNGLGTDAQSSVAVVTFETRPVGINDEYLAQSGRPFTYDVLGNDDDFDSDPLTAIFLGGPYYYSEDGSQVADTQTSISLSSSGSVTINGTAFESDVPEGELSRLTYFEYAAVDPDGNESLPVEVRVEIVVEADPDDDDADGDGEPDGSGSEDENPNDPNLPGDPNGNDGGTGGGGNNANSPNNPGGSDLPPGPGGQGGGAGNGESGVWGDIHVTTFGRLKYDFQAIGEFVAARATDGDPFELQIRTGAWGSTASVTTAIATSIDGHKVSYDTLTNEIRIDDAVVSMAANTSIALGGGAVHRGNGDNYAFTYADDRQVVYAYDRGAYIDYLIVATADRVGEIVGIADSENGQLVLPDGSLLPSNPGYAAFYSGADSFANSWRISDAGSFFTYGAGESTATFSDPDFPPFAVSIADLPANLVAEATLRVDNAGITDPAIRDAAILDLVLTGDPRMLTSSQQAVDPTEALTVQSTPLPKLVGIGAETLALPEGNTGTTAFSFTVYRTNNVGALSVDYAVTTSGFNITSPVEADAFVGGLLPAGTVAFADGESSKTITIEIAGDANIETNEQFAVALGAVSSTEFGLLQPSVMALLQDDDAVKPTAVRDQFAADEGEIITGNVLANDTANNGVTLAARLVRLPENGTLTLNADGSFTYTPEAGFAGTDFFLYRATDAFSSSTSQIVQFDIARLDNTGPSVAVIAAPAPIVEAVDASAQIASARGTISITDPDNGDRLNATVSAPVVALNGAPVSSTLAAQFASLTAADALRFGPSVTSNGTPQTIAWNYQPAAADLDVLAAGDQLTITYQVRASDGAATSPAQPLIITIAGANDAATIGGTPTGTVTEDGTLTASGALTIADADDGEAVFVAPDAASLADAFGDFTFDAATGAWSYALDNARAALQALNAGDTRIETLSVASLDGTATQAISVTVQGADDAVAITNGNAGGTLKGTSRNDIFEPKGGIDIVKAGSGDDIIRAAINDDADFYYGGGGSDTVDYSALTRSISAQLDDMFCVGTGLVTGHQSGIDVLRSIENIVGTSADDTISGNRFANRLEGSGGNDWLTGDGGSDTFVFKPGFGNDRITDFDANPRGGQDYIELSGFGITADDFAARVTITDVGADTLVTIDDDPANTIRLVGIGKPATVGVDDFFLT